MENPWSTVIPIFEQYGTSASVQEFHQQVNIHFHAVQSRSYDSLHQEMWDSLPAQFELLMADVLPYEDPAKNLRLLDIGSGTGLSTELLLKTPIGKRITDIQLLDTSREMLDCALRRSMGWGIRTEGTIGLVSDLPIEQFDIVVTCSVLHHIPVLPDFLSEISARQRPGGIFLHLQDPNKDFLEDPEFLERSSELRRDQRQRFPKVAKMVKRWNPIRLTRRIVSGPEFTYIDAVNQSLLNAGVLRSPLTADQIWTITDIHDRPDHSSGISLTEMRSWLKPYDLVSARTYGFFGKLISKLPENFAKRELTLRDKKAPNGYFLSAAWRKIG